MNNEEGVHADVYCIGVVRAEQYQYIEQCIPIIHGHRIKWPHNTGRTEGVELEQQAMYMRCRTCQLW